jgi:DNA polymerase III delta prime subunit
MKLHDILLEKASKQSLGHFYIVEGSGDPEQNAEKLESFVHHLIRDYYQKIEGQRHSLLHLMDHPDIFVLGNLASTEDRVDKAFTVDDAGNFARFFEFKAVQSKRKFAIITEAHRVNQLIANKWLKLLEEPQGNVTIFLLNPRGQKLLETIQSRAIYLRLPVEPMTASLEDWNELLKDAQHMSLASFLETYQKNARTLREWVDQLLQWEALQGEGAEHKEAVQKWLKEFQEMEIFNQPSATKWSLFYSYLHQHIIPRWKKP